MGDMGDVFNEMRAEAKKKRADNTVRSTALLQRAGVLFTVKNGGAHLVVLAGPHEVDFWPSTGLWIVRGQKAKRGGVRKLIEFVERSRRPTPGATP